MQGRQIIEEYVDRGLVRIEYRHLAILGDQSIEAAEASECAAAQGRFWDFYDHVFETWGTETFGNLNLKRGAETLGLDSRDFVRCLDTRQMLTYVEQDAELAASLGIDSTPSILINDRPIIGLQDYEVYRQVIDEELAKAGVAVN